MPGHTLYERKSLKEKKCPKCGGTTWIENQEKGTRNVFKDSIKMLTKKFKEAIAHFEKACKQHSEARYECQLQKWEKKNKYAGKWSSYEPQHNVQIAKLLSDDDSCVIDTKHGRFRIERRHGQLRQVGLGGRGEDFGRPVRLVPQQANYVNEHDDRMTPSPQLDGRTVYYCGCFIGIDVMRKACRLERSLWDKLMHRNFTDGRCGPNGPQCASCKRCIDSSATDRVIDSFQVMYRAKMAVDNYNGGGARGDGKYDHGALLVEEAQLRRTRGTLARMKHDLAEASKAVSQATGLMPNLYDGMFDAPKATILRLLSTAKQNFKDAKSNMPKKDLIPVLCEVCLDTGKAPCSEKDCKTPNTFLNPHSCTVSQRLNLLQCRRPCRRCCQNNVSWYGMLRAGWRVPNSDDSVEDRKVYYYVYSEEHGTFPIDKITRVRGKIWDGFQVEFTVKGETKMEEYDYLEDHTLLPGKVLIKALRN